MKRFYKNTIMIKVSKYTLRVFALLCVLLGVSSSAWAKTCYVDATSIVAEGYIVELDFIETMNSERLEKTLVEPGLWSFECPASKKLKINIRANQGSSYGDWKLIENIPAYTSSKNSISLTYTNKTWSYSWKFRSPYMGMTIYFQPTDEWKKENAWFAAYFSDKNGKYEWKKLEISVCDPAAYVTTMPDGDGWDWSSLKINFCRMNPASTSLNWDSKWNQTNDQNINDNINDGDLDVFNTGRTWAQIKDPWGHDGYEWATVQWYNTSCTEQAETYSLAGTFNSWDTKSLSFVVGKGASGAVEVELTAGTYEFKLVKNESVWYGVKDKTITNETNGLDFLENDGGNCKLVAGMDGVYTFTFGENWIDDGKGGKKYGMWLKVEYGVAKEPVLLANKASYSGDNEVKLSAYIQYTYCGDAIDATGGQITDWGFVVCPGSATSACTPTKTSSKKYPTNRTAKYRGEIFEHTLNLENDNLIAGAMYGYRGYVVIGGKMYLTKETGTFFFPGDCTQQEINGTTPIIYTIDASLGEDYADDCNLRYGSLQEALNRLRALSKDTKVEAKYKYATYDETNRSLNLNVPIEFHVAYYDDNLDDASSAYCYEGDTKAIVSGGGGSSENSYALIIKEINRKNTGTRHTFTIKSADEKNRPWLHHVIIRESKDVILDNLALFSDPTSKDHDDALELDCNSKEWHTLEVGHIEDANIIIKNCLIGSNGFTGVHASAYDGITFENNEFEIVFDGTTSNDVDWGASAKFMACKNIKFIRNNFRGEHATLLWIQDTQNALFMNNVFWNTNKYKANCSAAKLVEQYSYGPTKNIGFYYNTFYLADGKIDKDHSYDFLHTSDKGGDESGKFSNVTFQYNNCYSYDTDAPGKSASEPDGITNATLCPNNYWSVNSKAKFAMGSCTGDDANIDVNVSDIVCKTSATGPASLTIKGGVDDSGKSLNMGVKLTSADIKGKTGIELTEVELTYDRYNKDERPNDNTWTYGAYQAKEDITVNTIYWVGVNEKWDNRNNWGFYESGIVGNQTKGDAPITRSAELQRLSCVNNLSNDLKVIIPEKPLVTLEDGRKWPELPALFDSGDRETKSGIPVEEQVTTMNGELFAHTIQIEYGAALKGVTSLKNGNRHYVQAITNFEAPRDMWVLVGTLIQPFIDENNPEGGVRNLLSGDFYQGREPQVYMHGAEVDEYNNVPWGETFADMYREILPNEVFAINIPNEYGVYKIPAYYYYQYEKVDPSRLYHNKEAINYDYKGLFLREQTHITASLEKDNKKVLLSNSYPCNLSAAAIEDLGCNVSCYNFKAGSFMPLGSSDIEIKPQHGFVLESANAKTITLNANVYADGNTRTRSAKVAMPAFDLNLSNANNADGGYSMVVVRYDELKGEENTPADSDTKKVFSANVRTPDLYMIMYDGQYSRLHLGKTTQQIPLGIRIKTAMNVRFEQITNSNFSEVTLIDTQTGREYNLLARSYTTEQLAVGDLEGRFYLQVAAEEENKDNEEEDNSGDVSTEINENSNMNIQIYTDEHQANAIRVITNNVELETIYITDMVGRVYTYQATGNTAYIQLPVPAGVYVLAPTPSV